MKYKILGVLIVLSMFLVFTSVQADTLRIGSQSSAVTTLQQLLTSKGYSLVADGNFGTITENAVKNFQTANGLVPDGIVGPKTLALLNSLQNVSTYTPINHLGCNTLYWTDNNNKSCASPREFCGTFIYLGLHTFGTQAECKASLSSFPAGCTSASGYSLTTGLACDGSQGTGFPAGCNSAVGYSSTTGLACDGSQTTTTFPAGCTSASGFSLTTGLACDGSQGTGFPAGCTSAIGYSLTTGLACDGSQTSFPSGCTSTQGYSTTTGLACDGSGGTSPYPAGCTSNIGYSLTTGLSCAGTFPAGCTSASGYSTTTGLACN